MSAFGFGGTNFHIVMEEHVPGRLTHQRAHASIAVPARHAGADRAPRRPVAHVPRRPRRKAPLRGALVLGAADEAALANELRTALAEARQGRHLDPAPPSAAALRAPERIAIDYADGDELAAKAELALRALQAGNPAAWPALRARGIFRGSGRRRARSPSSTPARARSTPTCSPTCAAASRSWPRSSTRPTRS